MQKSSRPTSARPVIAVAMILSSNGSMMAESSPQAMSIARKVRLIRRRLGSPNEMLDSPQVVLSSGDGTHSISRSVAETVSVEADPAPPSRPPLPEQLVLSSDRYGR